MDNSYERLIKALPEELILLGRERDSRSAVLVPFVNLDGTEYIIFEKRAKGIKQEGEICFPGGKIDSSDMSPESAAVRETVEELGIPENKIRVDSHLGYLVSNIGAALDVFIGRILISSFSELAPRLSEVESIHAVPFSFFISSTPEKYILETEIKPVYYDENGNSKILFPARELGLPEMYHSPWAARKAGIYVYKYSGIVIWGLTAAIVYELTGILGQGGDK